MSLILNIISVPSGVIQKLVEGHLGLSLHHRRCLGLFESLKKIIKGVLIFLFIFFLYFLNFLNNRGFDNSFFLSCRFCWILNYSWLSWLSLIHHLEILLFGLLSLSNCLQLDLLGKPDFFSGIFLFILLLFLFILLFLLCKIDQHLLFILFSDQPGLLSSLLILQYHIFEDDFVFLCLLLFLFLLLEKIGVLGLSLFLQDAFLVRVFLPGEIRRGVTLLKFFDWVTQVHVGAQFEILVFVWVLFLESKGVESLLLWQL